MRCVRARGTITDISTTIAQLTGSARDNGKANRAARAVRASSMHSYQHQLYLCTAGKANGVISAAVLSQQPSTETVAAYSSMHDHRHRLCAFYTAYGRHTYAACKLDARSPASALLLHSAQAVYVSTTRPTARRQLRSPSGSCARFIHELRARRQREHKSARCAVSSRVAWLELQRSVQRRIAW